MIDILGNSILIPNKDLQYKLRQPYINYLNLTFYLVHNIEMIYLTEIYIYI